MDTVRRWLADHHYILTKYSNYLAFMMTLIAVIVCFTDTLLYPSVLGVAAMYLFWVTSNYLKLSGDQCPWEIRSARYDCQLLSLRNKFAIASNLVGGGIGFAFSMMMLINPEVLNQLINLTSTNGAHEEEVSYLAGFIKLAMMYIVVDKIHNTRMLVLIYRWNNDNLSHMTLGDPYIREDKLYPNIYIDGRLVSRSRYRVNYDGSLIGLTFSPPLALNTDEIIEFDMVPVNEEQKIHLEPMCTTKDHYRCSFKCQNVILPRITEYQSFQAILEKTRI